MEVYPICVYREKILLRCSGDRIIFEFRNKKSSKLRWNKYLTHVDGETIPANYIIQESHTHRINRGRPHTHNHPRDDKHPQVVCESGWRPLAGTTANSLVGAVAAQVIVQQTSGLVLSCCIMRYCEENSCNTKQEHRPCYPQRSVTLRTHIADHNYGRNRGNVKSADHQRTLRTGQSEAPLDGREHDAVKSVLQEAHDAVGVTQAHRIPDGPVEPLARFWAPFAPAVT